MTAHCPETPLSVLFVTAMYPSGEQPGNGAFVMHQAKQLRALGHQVEVVHVRGYRSNWNYLRGAVDVFRATWRRRYDVVHVHYGLTGVCALIRWRAPMVVTLHGSDVLRGVMQPLVSRFVSSVADATIVVSSEIGARCRGILIPCGVDLETFRPIDRTRARRELRLPIDQPLILFPFDPARAVKRYDLADAAVQLLRARGLDVRVLAIWQEANERMPLYYSAADVMVICSDSEGSPTSVKEALACGLPVVATNVGDIKSIVNGIDGTSICQQSAKSLADALERIVVRGARAVDGRLAMARFDQTRTVQAVVNVYRTVLRQLPSTAPARTYS